MQALTSGALNEEEQWQDWCWFSVDSRKWSELMVLRTQVEPDEES